MSSRESLLLKGGFLWKLGLEKIPKKNLYLSGEVKALADELIYEVGFVLLEVLVCNLEIKEEDLKKFKKEACGLLF